MGSTTTLDSIIKQLLGKQELFTPAIQWGNSQEPVTLWYYIDLKLGDIVW